MYKDNSLKGDQIAWLFIFCVLVCKRKVYGKRFMNEISDLVTFNHFFREKLHAGIFNKLF